MQKVKKNIQETGLFGRGDTIIVGVSGGPDSVTLAHVLHGLQYELGFHLHIAHFNHHLHRLANADQKFVEQLAEQLNIPCSTGHWENARSLKKGSIEDAARKQRLRFFDQLAKKIKAQTVVLAHTQDDLAETVLMRILRGTGLQGLRGILSKRKIDDLYFVRPLLNVKKYTVLAFLKRRDIPFRIDPTNKQTKFFRNKIRLELLPLLTKQYNQNIKELLTNMANTINIDYDYLQNQAQKVFTKCAKSSPDNASIRFNLKLFAKQHPALKRMLIRLGVEQLKGNTKRLTLTHFLEIEDLLQNRPKGSSVHLPRSIYLRKDSQYLLLATSNGQNGHN